MERKKEELGKKLYALISSYGKLFFTLTLLVIISLLVFVLTKNREQKLTIVFFDVGQGDSTLVITPSGKQMLIDGGRNDVVLERLKNEIPFYDRSLDVVVATHDDADHITGLISVIEKYSVDTFITSKVEGHTKIADEFHRKMREEESGSREVYISSAGDYIDFGDGVVATVVHPYQSENFSKSETNDSSVTILVSYSSSTILLTGDLPTTHENDLPFYMLPHQLTIYKAGHHGSKYSSGEKLLSYTKPEYSIISAGENNTYSHPNKEALDRLQKYSKNILSTITSGTIKFIFTNSGIQIETEK